MTTTRETPENRAAGQWLHDNYGIPIADDNAMCELHGDEPANSCSTCIAQSDDSDPLAKLYANLDIFDHAQMAKHDAFWKAEAADLTDDDDDSCDQ